MIVMMTMALYSQQETATARMYYSVMENMFKMMGMELTQIQNPPAHIVEFKDFVLRLSQRHYSSEEFIVYQISNSSEVNFAVILVRDGNQWFSRYYGVNVSDSILEKFF